MKISILLCSIITLSGCTMTPSLNDQTLLKKYPNCTNRENFFKVKQPDNNCIVMVKLKEEALVREAKTHQRKIQMDLELKRSRAERDNWSAEQKKQETFEAQKIATFNSLPGLTYDEFIAKVFDNPDDIGWSSKVKTRFGKNAPFMPVVEQQVGANIYIVKSMSARDNPNKALLGYRGRLLLVNSSSTLIEGMPIDQSHELRYDGITTAKTVMGAPKQVIAVTLTKTIK
jgi:hypothetical protein